MNSLRIKSEMHLRGITRNKLMLVYLAGMTSLMSVSLAANQPLGSVQDIQLNNSIYKENKLSDVLRLRSKSTGEYLDVLIHFRTAPEIKLLDPKISASNKKQAVFDILRQTANTSQIEVQKWLRLHNYQFKTYWINNSIATRVPKNVLPSIANFNDVIRIESDHAIKQSLPQKIIDGFDKQLKAIETNVTRVNADDVWALGFRGQGVVVGAQDTGYQWEHPALKGKYRGLNGTSADHNFNWHDSIHAIIGSGTNPCGLDSVVPCDDVQHGTHTLGTAIGDDGAGNQIGVAPDAKWIGCRNMERGNGRPSTYIECFEFFAAPTDLSGNNANPALSADVITNSWGCPPSELCEANSFDSTINNLDSMGILVVVAAGNGSASCNTISDPPAISDIAFTVGATTNADVGAAFSRWGPITNSSNQVIIKPDISAPGVGVRSSCPINNFCTFNGTSMAAPNVAGVAALLMSADPSLIGDPTEVKNILRSTAAPLTSATNCGSFLGAQIPNAQFGYGSIDALAAANFVLVNRLFRNGFE